MHRAHGQVGASLHGNRRSGAAGDACQGRALCIGLLGPAGGASLLQTDRRLARKRSGDWRTVRVSHAKGAAWLAALRIVA